MNKIDIISFYSSENFFRIKSIKKQTEKFEELKPLFKEMFAAEADQTILDILLHYQTEQKRVKLAREKAKLEKANKPISGGVDNHDEHIVKNDDNGRFVFTCAQNNTDIDLDFFDSLLQFCMENDAKLVVAKMTYNKNGYQQPNINADDLLWYDPKIIPYLVDGQISYGDNFQFIADAHVLPTAKNPLSGFDGITGNGVHAIIPASKIALKVCAALKGAKTKCLLATGTVTKRNYIMRKAGAVAAIEHNIGALFADIKTGEFRHLEQMQGCQGFNDLHKFYSPDAVHTQNNIIAFQPGDIHAEKMYNVNLDKILTLIQKLKPKNLILHDLMDFSSRNHHNIKDCTFLHLQEVLDTMVETDIKSMANIIDDLADNMPLGENYKVHVIESNHDLAINTWLKTADFKQDAVNSIVYLTCMLALYKHQSREYNNDFNMLEFVYREIGGGWYSHSEKLVFHKTDESVIIADIEMGNHGHNGVNGSRGSPAQFRNLGVAMNTGHTHSPCITGKVYTAGVTATLDMDYNKGASSWAIAHILTYANGQRQIIFSD